MRREGEGAARLSARRGVHLGCRGVQRSAAPIRPVALGSGSGWGAGRRTRARRGGRRALGHLCWDGEGSGPVERGGSAPATVSRACAGPMVVSGGSGFVRARSVTGRWMGPAVVGAWESVPCYRVRMSAIEFMTTYLAGAALCSRARPRRSGWRGAVERVTGGGRTPAVRGSDRGGYFRVASLARKLASAASTASIRCLRRRVSGVSPLALSIATIRDFMSGSRRSSAVISAVSSSSRVR